MIALMHGGVVEITAGFQSGSRNSGLQFLSKRRSNPKPNPNPNPIPNSNPNPNPNPNLNPVLKVIVQRFCGPANQRAQFGHVTAVGVAYFKT